MTGAKRNVRGLVIAAVSLLLCVAFTALCIWQIERRAWKLDLIARVEARVHAPAVAAPPAAQWPRFDGVENEYRHVQVNGVWLDEAETLVQAVTELGAGYWVMTPLRQADGSVVLINRGFVPPERSGLAAHGGARPATPVEVTGLLRLSEPRGGFLRSNDPTAGRWFSRDVQAIAAARGLGPIAPYFIDADADPTLASTDATAPVGGLTVVAFPNNHAVYAVTWFVLALMSAAGAWRVLREMRVGPLRAVAADRANTKCGTDDARV